MKTKKIILFISLVLLMLVTGVFWGTWFPLSRSIENFTPDAFLAIGKTIIANVAWPMRILMPTTILLLGVVCWQHAAKRSTAFYLYGTAFLLLVTVLLVTLIILVPLDNQFKVWTVESIPANWGELRDQWEYFHTWRTFLSIGSFAAFAGAMVFCPPVAKHHQMG